ncbi:hypothetical protein [Nostoc sp. GT001]|uniref:hypothetical protein n=1 Tax=Nostoc sp. GT001 TaxID=3056647 RepID=UPI0025AA67F3|nr:hypothetical protein [Nostoc sp. GT001]MDM9583145.1 hypothetical protein [Nostoc sp. GT001]
MKYLQRNPMASVFFFGLCVCLALSSGNLKNQWGAIASLQQKSQENTSKEWNLTLSQQQIETNAKIAEARYNKGCRLVVAKKSPGQFTTLTEGRPVFDRVRNAPLPVGTVVCDAYGNTARIINGEVVGEIAFTGNQAVIDKVVKRSKAKYSSPNL